MRAFVLLFWTGFVIASLLGNANVPVLSKFVREKIARGKTKIQEEEELEEHNDDDEYQSKKRRKKSIETTHGFVVPHAWFTHFYIVGTLWNATLLATLGVTIVRSLFQVHVTRRLFESVFVKINDKRAKMDALGYLIGLMYYVCASISLEEDVKDDLVLWRRWPWQWIIPVEDETFRIVFAILLFAYANYKQNECHRYLRDARLCTKRKDKYGLISKGWFSLVACPHYFFECVLYFALCLLLSFSTLSVAMFLAVVGNLSVAAKGHLDWYRANIPAFPKRRKAMVPFLF